ncbi:MAG: hypothetical protein MI922_24985, partial [Bacteroidales bacterium]|nr:hypothetical protein [Bacteroidales bacterium]
GDVIKKQVLTDKALSLLVKRPPINTKLVLKNNFDSTCFDIDAEEFKKYAYALFPPAQLSNFPNNYYSFTGITGTTKKTNKKFAPKLSDVRNKTRADYAKIEGATALYENPINTFNLASAHLSKANSIYSPMRKIDAKNYYVAQKLLDNYAVSDSLFSIHKRITDSIYKKRIRHLKTLNKNGIKLVNYIKTDYKKTKTGTNKKCNGYERKIYSLMDKKISVESRVLRTMNKRYQKAMVSTSVDTSNANKYLAGFLAESDNADEAKKEVKRIENSYWKNYQQQVKLLKEMSRQRRQLMIASDSLMKQIGNDNQRLINAQIDSLSGFYTSMRKINQEQRSNTSKLNTSFNNYYKAQSEVLIAYADAIDKLIDYDKETGNRQHAETLKNSLIDSCNQIKEHMLQVIDKQIGLLEFQITYAQKGMDEMKNLKRQTSRQLKYMNKYTELRLEKEQFTYNKEKELLRSLQPLARKRNMQFARLMDNFNEEKLNLSER